jgi:hypothetical protein
MPRLGRDRILGKPDAVCEQRVSAGVHDTVEGGVVGVCKRVKAVLGSRLQGSLNADQGISQLGCFGRAIILFVHDHSFVGLETETRSQSKPKMALAGILIGLQKNDIYLKYNG